VTESGWSMSVLGVDFQAPVNSHRVIIRSRFFFRPFGLLAASSNAAFCVEMITFYMR